MLASCASIWGADFLDDPEVKANGGADALGGSGGGGGGVVIGDGGTGGSGGGGGQPQPECDEGETTSCYDGPIGTSGVGPCAPGTKTCSADGEWGPCEGQVLPGTETCDLEKLNEDCDSEVNESGAFCVCTPSQSGSCYTGPSGTEGVGICHAGSRQCDEFGRAWGPCTGEQTPHVQEDCTADGDEDCNGLADAADTEPCKCDAGDTEPCFVGVGNPDAPDGICERGTWTCKPDSSGWEACTGQVPPATETCDGNFIDEDCDGEVNELSEENEPSNCVCKQLQTKACYTGPVATRGVGLCKDGSQACLPDGTGWAEECATEVLPGIENCDAQRNDEDCDGQVNEEGPSCLCMPNDPATPCYDELVGTELTGTVYVGICTPGTITCNDTGLGTIGACEGQGFPSPFENSSTSADEDCSGISEAISAGANHSCAIVGEQLKCWGANTLSQLGVANDAPFNHSTAQPQTASFGLVPKAVAAGGAHTCVLLYGGTVQCWGQNGNLELGTATNFQSESNPSNSTESPQTVPISDVEAISAGNNFTCALKQDGSVHCWGDNFYQQLGISGQDSETPLQIALPAVAVAVATGDYHACALLSTGKITCWGDNSSGQLGRGASESPGAPEPVTPPMNQLNTANGIAAGGFHTCAINDNGALYCWGLNSYGQLGTGNNNEEKKPKAVAVPDISFVVTSVSAGYLHTCATTADKNLWCWGQSALGRLGLGPSLADGVLTPTKLETPQGVVGAALGVDAGRFHTCSLTKTGADATQVWCWGAGNFQQNGTSSDPAIVNELVPAPVDGI